jgi:hypothetical protein
VVMAASIMDSCELGVCTASENIQQSAFVVTRMVSPVTTLLLKCTLTHCDEVSTSQLHCICVFFSESETRCFIQ